MARGRRKVVAILSDEEAVPPTSQQQLDITNRGLSDVDSEPDVPLARRKKPRLEEDTTAIGELPKLSGRLVAHLFRVSPLPWYTCPAPAPRPAKAKALSDASKYSPEIIILDPAHPCKVWLTSGAPTGKAPRKSAGAASSASRRKSKTEDSDVKGEGGVFPRSYFQSCSYLKTLFNVRHPRSNKETQPER